MSPIKRSLSRAMVLCAMALLVFSVSGARAAGSSFDGTRGLLRVHSADPHDAGYIAGTVHGLYAREQYLASQSPRGQAETVKFGGTMMSFAYAPSQYVELAVRGAFEGQFVNSAPADFSQNQFGFSDIGLSVKTLLTPITSRDFMLGAELGLATATGNRNAMVGTWDSDGMDLSGRLALTYQHLGTDDRSGLRLHMNTGYLNRTGTFDEAVWATTAGMGTPTRSIVHGDQFVYGAAIEVPTPQGWTIFTEWSGEYDVNASAAFMDNPMRVTPGLRWAAPSQSFVWTSGVEIALASEESMPRWQVVGGVSLGAFVAPVNGHLRGLVRDADTGEPVEGATVSVRSSTNAPATTDPSGRFQTEIEEGYAVLELAAEGYNPKTRVVEIQAHNRVDFDFTLTKRNVIGGVQGRIRDSVTGVPLFARIRVAGTEPWVQSDPATGAFKLEEVTEGAVQLEVAARNYKTSTITAQIGAGDMAVQDVSLERDVKSMMGVLSGYVRDKETGTNVPATVTVRGKTTATANADPENGLYEFEIEAGTYNIFVTSPGYVAAVESIEIPEAEASVKNFELGVLPKKMTLSNVFFDSGAATIKRESFASLETAAKFLEQNAAVHAVIEGHTDSTGSIATNMTLSQLRADAVMKFLVVNYGLDPKRLTARGLGPQEPVASNETMDGRSMNRRIEFRLEESVKQ